MGSSGQNVGWQIARRDCEAEYEKGGEFIECGYGGIVDTEVDAEAHTRTWECPVCKTEHVEEF